MTKDSVYQQLCAHLGYLKLAAAAEALPEELERARNTKTGHTEFVEALLRIEVDATEQRRLNARRRYRLGRACRLSRCAVRSRCMSCTPPMSV